MLYEGETNFWLGTSRCDINWTYFKHNMDFKQQQKNNNNILCKIPSNKTVSYPHITLACIQNTKSNCSGNGWFCFFLVAELRKIAVVKDMCIFLLLILLIKKLVSLTSTLFLLPGCLRDSEWPSLCRRRHCWFVAAEIAACRLSQTVESFLWNRCDISILEIVIYLL